MNFLKDLTKGSSEPKAPNEASPTPDLGESKSDLFANAKVVAEAAQAQFSKEPTSYDKAKAAGAGAEILDAGEKYAKLDENTGAGKYVEQAEDYLRKYGQDSKPAAAAAAPVYAPPAAAAPVDAPAAAAPAVHEEKKPEESGGGAADLMKKAGGLFK